MTCNARGTWAPAHLHSHVQRVSYVQYLYSTVFASICAKRVACRGGVHLWSAWTTYEYSVRGLLKRGLL